MFIDSAIDQEDLAVYGIEIYYFIVPEFILDLR